jgi:hypothetical protein
MVGVTETGVTVKPPHRSRLKSKEAVLTEHFL